MLLMVLICLQYGMIVDKMRSYLSSSEGRRVELMWKQLLAGDLPVLDLPTDHARGPLVSHDANFIQFRVPQSLAKEAGNHRYGTPYIALLSAFSALLRYFLLASYVQRIFAF